MYPPADPIEDIIQRAHKIALTLMDETVTISVGMNTPNQIVTSELSFESLETEPDPNTLRGITKAVEILTWHYLPAYALFKLAHMRRAH